MTVHNRFFLKNGDLLEFKSNVGAAPKYLLNGNLITKEKYDELMSVKTINEKIKALLNKSGINIISIGDDYIISQDVMKEDIERFAELIINECIEAADEVWSKWDGRGNVQEQVRLKMGLK